jgi:hypothetical protein
MFEFGAEEIAAMEVIKDLVIRSPVLHPLNYADTPQAPSPRVDRSQPNCSNVYRSSTQNADATTLRTLKVDDISLSILTIATPGDRGLSYL